MDQETLFHTVNLIAKLQRKYGRRLQQVLPVEGQPLQVMAVYRNGDGTDHRQAYVLVNGEAEKVEG